MDMKLPVCAVARCAAGISPNRRTEQSTRWLLPPSLPVSPRLPPSPSPPPGDAHRVQPAFSAFSGGGSSGSNGAWGQPISGERGTFSGKRRGISWGWLSCGVT